MNKWTGIGRITKDIEVKYTTRKTAVCNITIATQTAGKDVDFIPVVVWGVQAENLAKYCYKGSLISVIGRLTSRKYEDAEGNVRYITEVVADNFGGITYLSSTKKSSYLNDVENISAINDEMDTSVSNSFDNISADNCENNMIATNSFENNISINDNSSNGSLTENKYSDYSGANENRPPDNYNIWGGNIPNLW